MPPTETSSGDSQARCEVVERRVHQRAAVNAAAPGLDERFSIGIKVGQPVVLLILRRHDLIPQTGIDRQLRRDLEVVLEVHEVEPLAKIHNRVVGQRV